MLAMTQPHESLYCAMASMTLQSGKPLTVFVVQRLQPNLHSRLWLIPHREQDLIYIVLRADIKPIVDGETARCAASPSISVLTYLRIAIAVVSLFRT